MSRFGFVFIAYIIYLSVLLAGNSLASAMNQPVLALGYIGRWYTILGVFLLAYISEWVSLLLEKQ